jgi:integrase
MPRLERLQVNPCRDAGRPEKPKARERVLSDEELRGLWTILENEPLPWRPAIRLLILTGQRRDEVFSAEWSEFDLAAALWTIPAARAKNGISHLVPLSPPAVQIIAELPVIDGTAKLFPSRSNPQRGASGFSKALRRIHAAVSKEIGAAEHFTLHDLRRTVATGLQALGVRLEVTEAVLNHVAGSRAGVVGVYQRHNFLVEKRVALDAWAQKVGRTLSPGSGSEVVRIHG